MAFSFGVVGNRGQPLYFINAVSSTTREGFFIGALDFSTPHTIWQVRFNISLTPAGLRNCILTTIALAALGIHEYNT